MTQQVRPTETGGAGGWRRALTLFRAARHLRTLNHENELIDESRGFTWELDAADGRLLFLSRSVESMLGYSIKHWFDTPDLRWSMVHPDDLLPLQTMIKREVKKGGHGFETEYRLTAVDGRTVRVRSFLRIEPPQGKRNARIHGLTLDVSDLQFTPTFEAKSTDDADTGFLSRDSFISRLRSELVDAAADSDTRAVVVLSLDGIAEVRDHLGSPFAANVLRAAAERLTEEAPATVAAIGRTGFLEFSVILRPGATPRSFTEDARHLTQSLGRTYRVNEQDVTIGQVVSGVSLFPGQADDAVRLHQQALFAMRRARIQEVDVETFDPQAGRAIADAHRLVSELPGAIDRGELRVHFQPLVSIVEQRVTSMEALVRWDHPQLGLLSPGRFIEVTEATGAIRLLTDWLIASVIRQIHEWQAAGIAVPVSINLSARDLADDDLLDVVKASLHSWGVPSNLLKFEVTERTVLRDLAEAARNLRRLQDLGASISLDDFGTGHAGCAYLLELPANEVKVDQSFVREAEHSPRVRAVVNAIVSLSGQLGCDTVAEGVETEEQLKVVSDLGFTTAQGFYLARPMPAPDLTALLSRQST